MVKIGVPAPSAADIWAYGTRTLTGFTGTPRTDLVGSDSAIWAHATRELTKHKVPFNRAYVPRWKTVLRYDNLALAPLVNASDPPDVHIDSGYSITNTYVNRLNQVFLSDIAGVGVLKSYKIYVLTYRCYVGNWPTTYYYKMSIQPIVMAWDGTVTNLESERDIHEHTRSEEATPSWILHDVRQTLAVDGLSLSFNGILGVRLKTYSRSDALVSGSENGMGFAHLGATGRCNIILRGELEV